MRIAFVSFEFPPDTSHGGISTYLDQAVNMLGAAGHEVEVFAGSRKRSGQEQTAHALIHRVKAANFEEFSARVAPELAHQHACRPFDVVEAAEFQAEYRQIARELPDLPLVVKL